MSSSRARSLHLLSALLSIPCAAAFAFPGSGDGSDLQNCKLVLKDLDPELSVPFCKSYGGGPKGYSGDDGMTTITVHGGDSCKSKPPPPTMMPHPGYGSHSSDGGDDITSSSDSLPPPYTMSSDADEPSSMPSAPTMTPPPATESMGPGIAIITSTITTTITTTVTPLTTVYLPGATPLPMAMKRMPSAFCPDQGVPCRLVPYDKAVVEEACSEFLAEKEAEDGKAAKRGYGGDDKTVTVTVCGGY